MQVINSLDEIRIVNRTAVALGNFDGVHIGHRAILQSAVDCAKAAGLSSVCYTFSNHPANYFLEKAGRYDECVKLICTDEEKLRMLDEIGFDTVINLPFDESICKMKAADFIHKTLADQINAAEVFCGFNYNFGDRAEGNVELLQNECRNLDINVNVLDAVCVNGVVVSSTEVRRLIAEGDMETLSLFLGRNYSLGGNVSHGSKVGRKIGFPTVNVTAPLSMALPPNGVYFTDASVDNIKYHAITNIGVKPTVGGKVKSIETNMFDFDGDLYGKDVNVEFLKWERPEKDFGSIEMLQKQIEIDCAKAREYHEKR